jgi:FMN-dependent oxidoreductase (nitrilotriacetate monooxygenase family)
MTKKMYIGTIVAGAGSHVGGWRMPEAQFGSTNFEHLENAVNIAERGKFDFAFFADAVNSGPGSNASTIVRFEPLALLGALDARTSNIGLVATVSSTYSEPYNVARSLDTIDHISGGRVGWNVVTSVTPAAAQNFTLEDQPSHSDRYERAEEYVQVTKGLWDSWEDDALVGDKALGVCVDMDRMGYLNHHGKYFHVKGPLNITRSPQGYPVIFQAGASDRGIAFAGATAEVVFTAQQTQEETNEFTRRLRDAAEAAGRPRDAVKVLCCVCPIIGKTREEAQQRLAQVGAMIDPVAAIGVLSERLGYDMNQYDLDELLPDLPLSTTSGSQGHARQLLSIAKRQKMTLRQLRDYAAASSGHRLIIGTAKDVADDLEDWSKCGVTDGFAVMSPTLPGSLLQFVDEVVPILVERGLFRADYEGTTLRDHLGLLRPSHPRNKAQDRPAVTAG